MILKKLSVIIRFALKYSNLHMDFLTNQMFDDILKNSPPIPLIKSIRDNYNIYSLIIVINARLLGDVTCGFFKMSKLSHLTILLPCGKFLQLDKRKKVKCESYERFFLGNNGPKSPHYEKKSCHVFRLLVPTSCQFIGGVLIFYISHSIL